MFAGFLTKFGQGLKDSLPLQSFERATSRWRYAPIESSENGEPALNKSTLSRCIHSKAFSRTVIVTITILSLGYIYKAYYSQWNSIGSQHNQTDWSQYAYCQYVTNEAYLCNSLMIFESLVRLRAKADLLMMYPGKWTVGGDTNTGRLLAKAKDEYGVHLMPIHVQHLVGDRTWADSFTKLLAFNQTEYKRLLSLDSDATVLQPMDELFELPSAPVAMPRAYWLDKFYLSSQIVLLEPSEFEFKRILDAFEHRASNDFDMEIVNDLYAESCFIIPHRKYNLLSGEFRAEDHEPYLGNDLEQWHPYAVRDEAKFLHFSDWPYPKPWIHASKSETEERQPKCREREGGELDCKDREIWLGLYDDFRERRVRVCGDDFRHGEKHGDDIPRRSAAPGFEPIVE